MRKSFWMIPLVLLFTVLGSTTAHADTIVTSGGFVTGINGITIAGTTYNVTWGPTIDTTFASSPNNAAAINTAIANDLTAQSTLSVVAGVALTVTNVGVDAGANTLYAFSSSFPCLIGTCISWGTTHTTTTGFTTSVSGAAQSFAWDEFAVVAVPEPATQPLTLAGLGVIAVLMWKRRQDALRHAQAT